MKKVTTHLNEWNYMARRLFDAHSLTQVQIQVEEMRRKELKLVHDLGNLQIELNSLNRYENILKPFVGIIAMYSLIG